MLTDPERIAALEARLKVYDAFFTFGLSDDGLVPYVSTAGRVGVMTNYWAKQPVGQGAGLSVGTAIDRFAGYFEIDPGPDGFAACPDHPSTAVYAAVVAPHRAGEAQANLALECHAANSHENIAVYAQAQFSNAPTVQALTPVVLVETVDDQVVRRRVIGL